jgi:hypothetical protein
VRAEAVIRRHIEEPGEWILAAGNRDLEAEPSSDDDTRVVV